MKSQDIRIIGKGVAPYFPERVTYFQEVTLMDEVSIPPQKPSIEDLVDVSATAEVTDYKLIQTAKAVSYEGQHLTGQKLNVSISFGLQFKYVGQGCPQTVHVAHNNELMQTVFIVVPETVDGERVCDILRKQKTAIRCYIEDIYAVVKDCRTIRIYLTYLVDVKLQ